MFSSNKLRVGVFRIGLIALAIFLVANLRTLKPGRLLENQIHSSMSSGLSEMSKQIENLKEQEEALKSKQHKFNVQEEALNKSLTEQQKFKTFHLRKSAELDQKQKQLLAEEAALNKSLTEQQKFLSYKVQTFQLNNASMTKELHALKESIQQKNHHIQELKDAAKATNATNANTIQVLKAIVQQQSELIQDPHSAINRTSSTSSNTHHNFSWMDTTGVTLSGIQGDFTTFTDVIYTGDTRLPIPSNDFVHANWAALSYILHTSPAHNKTCLAFFKVDSAYIEKGDQLHPVWGRVPATALVMNFFPKAHYFLYMDSDAILTSPNHTPGTMYRTLAHDGYGTKGDYPHRRPGLIVNKPNRGWLCMQCRQFGLGHGCINSGVLLWRRSEEAQLVLKAWWESRLYNASKNLFDDQGHGFHGWSKNSRQDKMGEQNRLMYIFRTNPSVQEAVWPVPRQLSSENFEGCPKAVDARHTPCLQDDFALEPLFQKNGKRPACFVNHFANDKKKMLGMMDLILRLQV